MTIGLQPLTLQANNHRQLWTVTKFIKITGNIV